MRRLARSGADPSIPTSSMADIAFLLIIFFMVTSVFAATKGLELRLPDDDRVPPDPDPREAVLIHVRPGDVLVDCRSMPVADIRTYLEPVLSRYPDKPVILYTESDAEYRAMVAVYDVLVDHVTNIVVPTASDIEDYVALFGDDPLRNVCR